MIIVLNNLFEKINVESRNAKFLYDSYKNQTIIVDNSYQRKYVWTPKHQIKLIETVLMGFPVPEIYLWQQSTDPDTGETKFSIVDGQQRLGALFKYINNEYALNKSVLDEDNSELLSGKFFKDLEPELKARLWKYNFSVRFIDDAVDRETIIKLFLKLNSTEFTLNPQELRNAQFDGLFLNLVEKLADQPFWKKNSIFKDADIRRMKDIQIISTLLIFIRKGIEDDYTQKNINQIYDLYNLKYDESDEDEKLFIEILEYLDSLLEISPKGSPLNYFFKFKTHFYSLFTLAYYLIKIDEIDQETVAKLLSNWFVAYQSNNFSSIDGLEEYKQANQEATLSKSSRLKRFDLLKKYILSNV